MSKSHITANHLREILNYNPATGIFTWKVRNAKCVHIGDVAGCTEKRIGYITIGIDGNVYKAHRLAWLYMTNEWPNGLIDHINGQKADNRFFNLRVVDAGGNSENVRKPNKRNKSGFIGVIAYQGKWRANITVKGKTRRIGDFSSPEEAHKAYLEAKRILHLACTI
jgi:hypothetical protein